MNPQEEAARELGISPADAEKLRRAAQVTILDQCGAASRDQRLD